MTPRLALLNAGGTTFALPLEKVWHILLEPPLFPLVLLRPGFRGVFLHQGEVLPLMDPAACASAPAENVTGPYVVVCETDLGPLGLAVEQVLRIVELSSGEVAPSDPQCPSPIPAEEDFVCDGRRYPLLDLERAVRNLPR